MFFHTCFVNIGHLDVIQISRDSEKYLVSAGKNKIEPMIINSVQFQLNSISISRVFDYLCPDLSKEGSNNNIAVKMKKKV